MGRNKKPRGKRKDTRTAEQMLIEKAVMHKMVKRLSAEIPEDAMEQILARYVNNNDDKKEISE